MKTIIPTLLAAIALGMGAVAHAKEKKVAGPNGGRILAGLEPRAEFFVMADRKVKITFLNKDGKPVAPADQVVNVTAGDRSAPTRLTFVKSDGVLVSNAALPAGNDFPTVVQIKPAPDGKTVVERFNLDLSICDECKKAEYACICDH
jgi:hypothetical protein